MLEFLMKLFDSDFIPHGHCYFWQTEIVWLHVVSDRLIGLAYYAISIALLYFAHRRHDVSFHWMFLMFGSFIFACGTTHLMEVWTLWNPIYRLSGTIKLGTALVSSVTAILLVSLVPKALVILSPAQLEFANEELERQITQRLKAEEMLLALNENLEHHGGNK